MSSNNVKIKVKFGVNEVEAVIKNLSATEPKGQYEEKEGVVIRYFDNQYIPFDQYKYYQL